MKYIKKILIDKEDLEFFINSIIKLNIKIDVLETKPHMTDSVLQQNKDLILKSKIMSLNLRLIEQSRYYLDSSDIEKINDIILETNDKVTINNYVINILKRQLVGAEKYILEDSESIVKYANNILRKRWEECEKYLLKHNNPYHIIDYYVENVFEKGSDDNEHRWQEGERVIANNPKTALRFAMYYYKEPWPQGEKAILTDPYATYDYATSVFINRAPSQFEEVILKNPMLSYNYFLYLDKYFKIKWEKGLEVILNNPETAYDYSIKILKKRMPEVEKIISKSPKLFIDYSIKFLFDKNLKKQNRLINRSDVMDYKTAKEIEENIFKDPQATVRYINFFVKERIRELEEKIAEDALASYQYANLILKEHVKYGKSYRWIDIPDINPKIAKKAEKNILENFNVAIDYAKDVIRGRWKELEDIIIEYEDYPLEYAREVIDGPWPEAGITEEDVWPEPEYIDPRDIYGEYDYR